MDLQYPVSEEESKPPVQGVEITEEMIRAGLKQLFWLDEKETWIARRDVIIKIFHAMLSAQ